MWIDAILMLFAKDGNMSCYTIMGVLLEFAKKNYEYR